MHRDPAGPVSPETVFRTPGLGLLVQQIAGVGSSDVLDLGPPSPANIDYLSQYPCVLHIGDLARALAEDPGMSGPEEERDVRGAVERVLAYEDGLRLDAILAWDLFDYLDAPTVRAVMGRIGRYCRTGTLLYLTTSNDKTIPDEPGRFTIIDALHLRFQRVGMGSRSGMKHSPRGLERLMPGFHLQHSFLLGNGRQDYLFGHD